MKIPTKKIHLLKTGTMYFTFPPCISEPHSQIMNHCEQHGGGFFRRHICMPAKKDKYSILCPV